MENLKIISQIKTVENIESNLLAQFGLKFNPFPKSGIANIIESDFVTSTLEPAFSETTDLIVKYMQDALSRSGLGEGEKYLSLIIRGDYGTGKTQTLMFIKFLFNQLKNNSFRPYVVYIDNPGLKLAELIGNVLSQIGIENFRRYLWAIFLDYLENKDVRDGSKTRKDILMEEISHIRVFKTSNQPSLFEEQDFKEDRKSSNADLSWEKISISYKYLLDELIPGAKSTEQKVAEQLFKNSLIRCFSSKYELASVAEYFYDIVTDNLNVSKSWDKLVTGNIKNLDKREFHILHAIVEVAKNYLNATDFIILVDEFEEIAVGRLKDADLDNYLRNLRALIDKDKNWCSVFAMNADAYEKIRLMSPPLASRIGDRIIDLKPWNIESFTQIISNYLSLARIDNFNRDILYPFKQSAITAMLNVKDTSLKGSPRFLLKHCYLLLQRAAENSSANIVIDEEFVKKYMGEILR